MYRPWRSGSGLLIADAADGTPHVVVANDAAAFVRHGEALVAELPVRRLTAGAAGAHMAALIALPAFARMAALRLDGLGDAGAAQLGTARLPELRELRVPAAGLTAVGIEALVAGELARGLAILDVSRNAIGDAGAGALAAAALPQLRQLQCSSCAFGPEGGRALAAAPWLGQLAELDVRDNRVDEPAARALASAATGVRRIGLTGNPLFGEAQELGYDWDGTEVSSGPRRMRAGDIAERFGLGTRGVDVY